MWSVGISILGIALSFNALGVDALVVCNTRQPRDSESTPGPDFAKELKNAIVAPIGDICTTGFSTEERSRFVSYESGSLVFTITPTEENSELRDGCGTNFDQIIDECIAAKDLWGGSVLNGGVLYQIYNNDVFGTGFNDGYRNN